MVWPTVLRLWCHSWPVVCVSGSRGAGSLGSQGHRTCPETTSQPLCREGGRSQPAGSRAVQGLCQWPQRPVWHLRGLKWPPAHRHGTPFLCQDFAGFYFTKKRETDSSY